MKTLVFYLHYQYMSTFFLNCLRKWSSWMKYFREEWRIYNFCHSPSKILQYFQLLWAEIFTLGVYILYDHVIQITIPFYNTNQYWIFQTALVNVSRLRNVHSYFIAEKLQHHMPPNKNSLTQYNQVKNKPKIFSCHKKVGL